MPDIQKRMDALEEKVGYDLEIDHAIAKNYIMVSLKSFIDNKTIFHKSEIYYKDDGVERIGEILETLFMWALETAEETHENIKKLLDEEYTKRSRGSLREELWLHSSCRTIE